MPLLGFKSRFAHAVDNGVARLERRPMPHDKVSAKRQTIRASRQDGRDPKVGDTLFLYAGLRTRHARKLGEVECRKVQRVQIDRRGVRVRIDGVVLNRDGVRRLARADGFREAEQLLDFLERLHGFPFDGWLIRW